MKRFSRVVAVMVALCMVCGLSFSGNVDTSAKKKCYVKSGTVYDMPEEMEVGDEAKVYVKIKANCKTKAFGKFEVETDDDDVVSVGKVKCAKPGSKGWFKLTAEEEGTAVITITTSRKTKNGKRLSSEYEIEVTDEDDWDDDDDDDYYDDDDYNYNNSSDDDYNYNNDYNNNYDDDDYDYDDDDDWDDDDDDDWDW